MTKYNELNVGRLKASVVERDAKLKDKTLENLQGLAKTVEQLTNAVLIIVELGKDNFCLFLRGINHLSSETQEIKGTAKEIEQFISGMFEGIRFTKEVRR